MAYVGKQKTVLVLEIKCWKKLGPFKWVRGSQVTPYALTNSEYVAFTYKCLVWEGLAHRELD